MARKLDALEREGWVIRDTGDRRAHLVSRHGSTFLLVTERSHEPAPDGVKCVVVVWDEFPEEVLQDDGRFFVHGTALLDFLRSQAEPLDEYEITAGDD